MKEALIIAKVKVEVLNAVVDGKGRGEQLEIEEKSAEHFEKLNYVKRVQAEEKSPAKPKQPTSKKAASTRKKSEEK